MEEQKFTAADLERWVGDLPQRLAKNVVERDLWPGSPRANALRHIAEIVHRYSLEQNETYAQTLHRLNDARTLFLQLAAAVTRKTSPPKSLRMEQLDAAAQFEDSLTSAYLDLSIWRHSDDLLNEFDREGYSEDENLEFSMRYISSFAAALIEQPWLKSQFMEWVIVDYLVCQGVQQLGQTILAGHGVRCGNCGGAIKA